MGNQGRGLRYEENRQGSSQRFLPSLFVAGRRHDAEIRLMPAFSHSPDRSKAWGWKCQLRSQPSLPVTREAIALAKPVGQGWVDPAENLDTY